MPDKTINIRLRLINGTLDCLQCVVRLVTGKGESLCAKGLKILGLGEALVEGRGGLLADSAHLVAERY